MTNNTIKPKVLVWLSWWVDSAVAAYLLQQQWYEVIAGFMKNYADESNPNCHTREDRNMAINVAQFLWIDTFIIFDFRQQYDERIVQYIYKTYEQWLTPNPDVLCNSLVKFDLFLEKALSLWCKYVATGHYVRKIKETPLLKRWIDHNKDQSYFLSRLSHQQIDHALFPLGEMTKPEVRKLAKEIWLPNADRPDSQWLCFIGKVSIKDFLKQQLPTKQGDIIVEDGTKVGEHEWAYFFTIGQSRWLNINKKAYVIDINVETNTVIVSYEKHVEWLEKTSVVAKNRHRLSPPLTNFPHTLRTKIRYRQEPQQATFSSLEKGIATFTYEAPQRAVAPGQILVAYDENECVIGSGIIS